VGQLAGTLTLVPGRGGLGRADLLTRERVELAQVRHAVAAQDPADRAWGQAQFGAEPVLTAPLDPAHLEHLLLDLGRGAARAEVRA